MKIQYLTLNLVNEAVLDDFNKLLLQLDPTLQALSLDQLQASFESDAIHLLIAKEMTSQQIVGTATIGIFKLISGKHAWLDDVVVDEKFRGQGIGKNLVKISIETAKKLGAKYLDLTSRPSRVKARQLYQELGFKERETNVYRYEF